jgi:KUP system potassium uptake protein
VHIIFEQTPRVDAADRAKVEELGDGLWRIEFHYGFNEIPNVSRDLEGLEALRHVFKPRHAVYFASRSLLDTHSRNLWSKFRCGLFSLLYRNAARTSDRFVTPIDQTMDITRHVKL